MSAQTPRLLLPRSNMRVHGGQSGIVVSNSRRRIPVDARFEAHPIDWLDVQGEPIAAPTRAAAGDAWTALSRMAVRKIVLTIDVVHRVYDTYDSFLGHGLKAVLGVSLTAPRLRFNQNSYSGSKM